MAKTVNTSLAKGYLGILEAKLFTASGETVIKFMPLINTDIIAITFSLWFNFAGGGKVPLLPPISLYQGYTLHLVDSAEEIDMAPGDFITGYANVGDKISYLITGREIVYDLQGV